MSFRPAGRTCGVHLPVQFGFAMLHDHPHGLKNGGHWLGGRIFCVCLNLWLPRLSRPCTKLCPGMSGEMAWTAMKRPKWSNSCALP